MLGLMPRPLWTILYLLKNTIFDYAHNHNSKVFWLITLQNFASGFKSFIWADL